MSGSVRITQHRLPWPHLASPTLLAALPSHNALYRGGPWKIFLRLPGGTAGMSSGRMPGAHCCSGEGPVLRRCPSARSAIHCANYTRVATIRADHGVARDGLHMAQRPLSPGGGRGEVISARYPLGTEDRVDHAAARLGLTRSEFVRRALLGALEVDPETSQEVAAQAS